jgi:hypothetical protein
LPSRRSGNSITASAASESWIPGVTMPGAISMRWYQCSTREIASRASSGSGLSFLSMMAHPLSASGKPRVASPSAYRTGCSGLLFAKAYLLGATCSRGSGSLCALLAIVQTLSGRLGRACALARTDRNPQPRASGATCTIERAADRTLPERW